MMTMTELFKSINFLCENGAVDEKLYVDVYRSAWVDGVFHVTDFIDEFDGMLKFYDKVFHKGYGEMIVSDTEILKNPETGKIDYLTIYLS